MFSIIVAIGKNNEIGKNNKLLWHIPEDLENFKKITLNKKIVMGRKTFESIGRPLPKRENIVLTRNNNYALDNEIKIYNDLETLLNEYGNLEEEIFILGGEQIYKEMLTKDVITKLYISFIDFESSEAHAYFPKINYDDWILEKKEKHKGWDFCIFRKYL